MKKLNALDWIAVVILFIGGLNWGLVGLFQIDLVEAFFGDMTVFTRIVYSLVGLSAIYALWLSFFIVKEDPPKET